MNAPELFESYRPLLFAIAYRMLGSAMEAEDMVQETFLRYQATSRESIQSPKAWLTEDVTLWADGGGKVRGATTRPLHGRQAVTRFLQMAARLPTGRVSVDLMEVNGEPAAILRTDNRAFLVVFIALEGERIQEIRMIGNPDKLQRL